MASSGIRMGLVLVLVLVSMLYSGAMAQSGCNNALTSLAPCLNYVTGNSTTPSSTCCSQLAIVVQSSPQCLCSLLNNNGPSLGITINQTLALSLPGACKVQTPPISQCKAATAPTTSADAPTPTPIPSAAAPTPIPSAIPSANSPADSSNETPEPTLTPSASQVPSASGSGSKTVPSTSDGNIIKTPHFMLFVFSIVWCGSTVIKF